MAIKWVGGLLAPIAAPWMRGLLRPFRRSGPTAALTSWSMGLLAFWLVNYPINWNVKGGVPLEYQVSVPLAVSLVLYILIGFVRPEDTPERLAAIEKINTDDDSSGAAAAVPGPREAVPAPAKD